MIASNVVKLVTNRVTTWFIILNLAGPFHGSQVQLLFRSRGASAATQQSQLAGSDRMSSHSLNPPSAEPAVAEQQRQDCMKSNHRPQQYAAKYTGNP